MGFIEIKAKIYRRPENGQIVVELLADNYEQYDEKPLLDQLRLELLRNHVLGFAENRVYVNGKRGFALEVIKLPSHGIHTGPS